MLRPKTEVGAVLLGLEAAGPATEGRNWWQVLFSECDKKLSSPN